MGYVDAALSGEGTGIAIDTGKGEIKAAVEKHTVHKTDINQRLGGLEDMEITVLDGYYYTKGT